MENQEVNKTDAADNPDKPSQEQGVRKKPTRTQEAQDKILANIALQTRPNFTKACQDANVNRTWAYEMREIDREFDISVRAALNRVREEVVDFVEDKFLARVMDKDKELSKDEIFILETIGKSRGYIKRVETAPLGAAGFSPSDLDQMTGEEMANAYTAMLKGRTTQQPGQ